ncbi:MAG: biotin synthase BioB [Candidatus Omnitrophota bacterium]|nr:biotin synthase BioB [Candidatus Omnitrophota bacterium]
MMDRDGARALLKVPLAELAALADGIRRERAGGKIELCSILNAKSGLCAEDCRFCAQSCHHETGINTYPLKTADEILEAAIRAKEIGAERFDIVTSGNALSGDELKRVADTISLIKNRVRIKICASLGRLSEKDLILLKSAGLGRYHHNIETSPGYFSSITTTHTFKDRIDTIKAAKAAGLEVCSGGIIGLGESWDDRIDMALTLKELDVTSVPINILVPIKGTTFEDKDVLPAMDAIRAIALFRIILQDKIIKVAAGRESVLKDFQAMAFMAGANGMLIGGYLTIKGRSVDEDKIFVKEIEKAWKA